MEASDLYISKRQIAYLHMLASRNHMTDDEYRGVLRTAAGVESSKQLRRADFGRVLDLMEGLGYAVEGRIRRRGGYGERPGFATGAQLDFLEGLARQVFGLESERPFHTWLQRYFHVSHPRFLTSRTAGKAIEGLKAMKQRKEDR